MEIEQLLLKVKDFYTLDENKYYHTLNHIRVMLNDYLLFKDKIKEYFPSLDENILIDSILWHDARYIPGYEKNEYNAAFYYVKNNDDYSITIIDIILSTIPFNNQFLDEYQKIVHDLDWLNFSSMERLKATDELIRNEYSAIDDETYYKNRLNFLQNILDIYGNHLYKSKVFEIFNDKAVENIKTLIDNINNKIRN